MVIKSCIILWIFMCYIIEGDTAKQNETIIAKMLMAIENRLNDQSSNLFNLQESINQLNQSFDRNNECQKTDFAAVKEQLDNFTSILNDFKSEVNNQISKMEEKLAAGLYASCPPNWSKFVDSCYHLNIMKADIDTAVEMCSNSSAYVVEIESDVELRFLKSLTDKHIWIGISDRREEGSWEQIRNEQRVKFSNWAPGQPNDYPKSEEDCAVMYSESGVWHDYQCNSTFAFICKTFATF